ncbi:MAG: hypothetical protein KGS72_04550 [Cyanobacteria bacterium REEB67]|nr:hypothetical protein [Cyanobacteria bacterium REEB67]
MYPNLSLEQAPIDRTMDQTQRRLVLKHQGQFLLLDLSGGMRDKNGAGLGFYVNDTRFLNRWEMTVGGQPLHFLTADVEEGFAGHLHYSNKASGQAVEDPVNIAVKADSLSIKREIVVDEKPLVSETITVQNHSNKPISTLLSLAYAADFADMFEVRGDVRKQRGHLLPTRLKQGKLRKDGSRASPSVILAYLGLDNILRRTRISFNGTGVGKGINPDILTKKQASFKIELAPQQSVQINCRITVSEKAVNKLILDHDRPVRNHGQRFDFAKLSTKYPLARARLAYENWSASNARITTNNADFNRLLERSYRDIYLLRQTTARGNAVAAGVPWFAVPFGRDSLITGLQTLHFMPQLSRDVLAFLAAYQGQHYDEATCEKPGRIMHELRPGEMAALSEIPFRPYYGTVDATQLWLMLFARYVNWSGDLDFARKLWPNVMAALGYLDRERPAHVRDVSAQFFSYGGGSALSNQGWKDSGNCIVYKNGELARGPIAVCEAQGYAYAAWNEVSAIAARLGHVRTASRLAKYASDLKKVFNKAFWMESDNMVALALDGTGRHCDVVASNAGHLLGTGILPPEREKIVSDRLMKPDMFSGWGIRTLAASETAYQPMDYQVGAVWPHDNGIIAHGMSRIGESESAHAVVKAMLDVATSQSDMRLPELFAGFERNAAAQPVPYQVACVPQLWAAGCAFHMTSGMLGVSFDSAVNTLTIVRPALPEWMSEVAVKGLRLGSAEVDLYFKRNVTSGATTVEISRVRGNVRCLVEY